MTVTGTILPKQIALGILTEVDEFLVAYRKEPYEQRGMAGRGAGGPAPAWHGRRRRRSCSTIRSSDAKRTIEFIWMQTAEVRKNGRDDRTTMQLVEQVKGTYKMIEYALENLKNMPKDGNIFTWLTSMERPDQWHSGASAMDRL